MSSWTRLDVGTTYRTRWQRIKDWIFGGPDGVYVTTEIAQGVVADVVEDEHEHRQLARAR